MASIVFGADCRTLTRLVDVASTVFFLVAEMLVRSLRKLFIFIIKKTFPVQSIQKIFNLILKTEALFVHEASADGKPLGGRPWEQRALEITKEVVTPAESITFAVDSPFTV